MNEAILRSPKWMRNFVDFEINTGEDIKGEPSEKRKKEIEKERQKKEAERKQREKEERESFEEEQRRYRKQKEAERNKEFDELSLLVIQYIYANYIKCNISIPKTDFLTIEKKELHINNIDFNFQLTLDNTIQKPTFDLYIKFGKEIYDYKISGLVYQNLKNFILTTVYEWYLRNKKSSSSSSKNYSGYSYQSPPKTETDPFSGYSYQSPPKTPPKTETDPFRANKKRRYDLLKNTLSGYQRELTKINDWEKVNKGRKHSDRESVENQISNVKDKINLMNSQFHFESIYYLKHLTHLTLS